MRKFFYGALALLVTVIGAYAATNLSLTTGTQFIPGFRLFDGSDLNVVLSAVNTLRNQADGTTAMAALGVTGHVRTGATPPVLTSCGTTPAITGSDTAGTVTMGTGTPTGCVITFASAYVTAPVCTVAWIATPLASQSYATSATAITLTQTATSSNVVKYICVGNSGG